MCSFATFCLSSSVTPSNQEDRKQELLTYHQHWRETPQTTIMNCPMGITHCYPLPCQQSTNSLINDTFDHFKHWSCNVWAERRLNRNTWPLVLFCDLIHILQHPACSLLSKFLTCRIWLTRPACCYRTQTRGCERAMQPVWCFCRVTSTDKWNNFAGKEQIGQFHSGYKL